MFATLGSSAITTCGSTWRQNSKRRSAILAFDSDALIYTEVPDHPWGGKVLQLLQDERLQDKRVGSTLLLPEALIKPSRLGQKRELGLLMTSFSYLRLVAPDEAIAMLAVQLGAKYKLKTPDAIHLATAVHVGADAFITNNHKDFTPDIEEVRVLYPERAFRRPHARLGN